MSVANLSGRELSRIAVASTSRAYAIRRDVTFTSPRVSTGTSTDDVTWILSPPWMPSERHDSSRNAQPASEFLGEVEYSAATWRSDSGSSACSAIGGFDPWAEPTNAVEVLKHAGGVRHVHEDDRNDWRGVSEDPLCHRQPLCCASCRRWPERWWAHLTVDEAAYEGPFGTPIASETSCSRLFPPEGTDELTVWSGSPYWCSLRQCAGRRTTGYSNWTPAFKCPPGHDS